MLHFYDLGSLTSFVCLVPMMSAHLSFEWHIEHVQLVVCMFNFIEVLSYIDLLWDIDAVEVEVRFRTQVFAQFQGTHLSIHSLWSSFLSFIAILCYTWVLSLDCVVISISFYYDSVFGWIVWVWRPSLSYLIPYSYCIYDEILDCTEESMLV